MSLKVLVVDDDASVRRLLTLTLPLSGDFEVVGEAADGFQAIEKARESSPDLIILDHMMPRKSGGDAVPELFEACPDGDIVLFSAYLDSPSVHESLTQLIDHYHLEAVPKGSIEDLEATVNVIADRRAASGV